MDITIIIVNWNAAEMLKNCISSICAHQEGLQLQIIVVDNASADNSVPMLKELFPEVTIIEAGGNIGFGRANNLAFPYVQAPCVLFLNPDTLIVDDAIQRMAAFLATKPAVGAIGCKIIDRAGIVQELPIQWRMTPWRKFCDLLFISGITLHYLTRFIPYHDPLQSGTVSYLYGACLMLKKEVLDQVGVFDERFFMYCEDVDLCERIGRAGWLIQYLSDVQILHLVGGATQGKGSAFGSFMMCESIAKYMRKYYGRLGQRLYTLAVLTTSSIRLSCLLLAKVLCLVTSADFNSFGERAIAKHINMVKWSLNMRGLRQETVNDKLTGR